VTVRSMVIASALLFAIVASAAAAAPNPAPATGPYDPQIRPADFVKHIDNRWFPLRPGSVHRYAGVAEDGKQRQTGVVFVTHRTKKILGVRCRVVRDTGFTAGKPEERTFDWYAQDRAGNVWYFGEDSRDYRKGHWVRSSGSWKAGAHGAKPGILMLAEPQAGQTYRQEYYPGHALDVATVLGPDGTVRLPFKRVRHALETSETSELEPGVVEHKYYAPGLGEIKSVEVQGGKEATRLVSVSRGR
jgi:hypothetical protein